LLDEVVARRLDPAGAARELLAATHFDPHLPNPTQESEL
jgi:hypothetical protein